MRKSDANRGQVVSVALVSCHVLHRLFYNFEASRRPDPPFVLSKIACVCRTALWRILQARMLLFKLGCYCSSGTRDAFVNTSSSGRVHTFESYPSQTGALCNEPPPTTQSILSHLYSSVREHDNKQLRTSTQSRDTQAVPTPYSSAHC